MPFVTGPALWLILGLICTNLFAGGMWWINSVEAEAHKNKVIACEAKYDAFVKQTEAASRIALAEEKRVKESNERNADETAKGWAAALDVVRNDGARRLRAATSAGSSGGGATAPPGSGSPSFGTDADTIPSPERVAADCAETTLTANFLQRYIENLQ